MPVLTQHDLPPLVAAAAQGGADLLARDIRVLEVGDVIAITDWFVVMSGSSTRQVRRVVDAVEAAVKDAGGAGALRVEGLDDASWVLQDFGEFVVHVFLDETREFYDIERLWSDVPSLSYVDADAPAGAADDAESA